MEKLIITSKPKDLYSELFTVYIDRIKCEDSFVAITKTGKLIYVEEKLSNQSSAYYMENDFYSIDKDEYYKYLSMAIENGNLNNAAKIEELKQLAEQKFQEYANVQYK